MSYETVLYDISAIEAKDHFCQHKLLFKSEQWDTLNGCVAILKSVLSGENLGVGG